MWVRRRSRQLPAASSEVLTASLKEQDAKDLFSYEILVQRELEQDAMLWQTPSLALTALAFLLTIALDFESSAVSRMLASGLGVVVVLLSMQLMAKHRLLSELDRDMLVQLEDALNLTPAAKRRWAYDEAGKYSGVRPAKFYTRMSSYRVWQAGLFMFLATNVGLLAHAVWVTVV